MVAQFLCRVSFKPRFSAKLVSTKLSFHCINFYHKKIKQQNIEFVIRPEVSVISTRLIATNWFVESSAR